MLEMYASSSNASLDSSIPLDSYILQHGFAVPLVKSYKTRKHVIILRFQNESVDMFEARSEEQLKNVIAIINYYAACTSREPAVAGTGMLLLLLT